MLSKFRKKSFSEDARRSRSILNGTVNLHVQATDHHRNIAGIGIRQHLVNVAGIWRRNPVSQIPATNLTGRIWPDPSSLSGSGHFRRNPVIPDFDETVRISAFISNSGYISRNQVKIVRIFSVSDRISSSMIFILFYINIFML
jgi:hypothetical protein